ncbi:unannotated protein [freshwater metagenome]|uniref:Unannotated protein n=1 Tax=freshwater metagenome TaxID=449393 RepID=A0A6J6P991_9ZZZZ
MPPATRLQVKVQSTAALVAAAPTRVLTRTTVSETFSTEISRETSRSRPMSFHRSAAAGNSASRHAVLRSLSVGARQSVNAQFDTSVLPMRIGLPVSSEISSSSDNFAPETRESFNFESLSSAPIGETSCVLDTIQSAATAQVALLVCSHTVSTPVFSESALNALAGIETTRVSRGLSGS